MIHQTSLYNHEKDSTSLSFKTRSPFQTLLKATTSDTSEQTESTAGSTTTTTNGEPHPPSHPSPSPPPKGILGPPSILHDLEIGQSLQAFRRKMVLVTNDNEGDTRTCTNTDGVPNNSTHINREMRQEMVVSNFTIERVSITPDVFVLRNYLSEMECQSIINEAKQSHNRTQAETVTNGGDISRKNCMVAWLSPNPDSNSKPKSATTMSLIQGLASTIANIFLSQPVLRHPQAGVEDLQVLEYDVGGEFVLHHDGQPRILTVIYYVNGVGGTWFPLAQTTNSTTTDKVIVPQNKDQALDLCKTNYPGKDGLLIKGQGANAQDDDDLSNDSQVASIRQGDAVVFYNYRDDGSGKLDWRALHAGLPTMKDDGVKWIANHWFRLNGDCL